MRHVIFLLRMFTSFLPTVYRSGFYFRFSRYSTGARRSIYNIWNFLRNLAATLVINITFRLANQSTGEEIPFEFIPVVRISGFTILLVRKVRERASPAEVKNREAFERRAMTSRTTISIPEKIDTA